MASETLVEVRSPKLVGTGFEILLFKMKKQLWREDLLVLI